MFKKWKERRAWERRVRTVVVDTVEMITYLAEPKGINVFQDAYKTIELGTGDCEDIAILINYRLVRKNLILKSGLLLLGKDKILGEHAVLEVISPQGKKYYIDNIYGLRKSLKGFEYNNTLGAGWFMKEKERRYE